ncbi:MAG: methyltransferase [Holosporaceae bacterium]|jgi:tRNA1(Val) A37 N6-methylase TrmN6|nr:methyltransferase [Holosporaceae bacterium]
MLFARTLIWRKYLKLTEDSILNRKIKIFQPERGYRVAIDPIILSNFACGFNNRCRSKIATKKILDVGCGVGTISLILKMKESTSQITAIDIDERICEICRRNARINSLNVDVINVGLENINYVLKDKLFDQIVTNPPFFDEKLSRISESKKLANFETMNLSHWIVLCFKKLKSGGIFSMIHDASRIDDILCSLKNIAGSIQIIPIFPKINCRANRIIVTAKKSSKSASSILPGIVVHESNGSYSEAVREILSGSFLQSDKKY